MASFMGNLSTFDPKVQDWEVFYGKLTQFVKLNRIEDENQCAVLLTHLSDESYRLAVNLVYPKRLEEVSFREIVQVLKEHFLPKRSTFADRAQFYEASQIKGERVEDWAARLRGLAVYCEFGSELQMLLRDRFVLGLEIGPERDRLFEQDLSVLTFSAAVALAQQVGCARRGRDSVRMDDCIKESVVQNNNRRETQLKQSRNTDGVQCSVCGLKNHEALKCRYKNYQCQKCGRKGHLKKVCNDDKSPFNCVEVDSQKDGNSECHYNLRLPFLPAKQLSKVLHLPLSEVL